MNAHARALSLQLVHTQQNLKSSPQLPKTLLNACGIQSSPKGGFSFPRIPIALSIPFWTVSKVVELLQGLKAIDRDFHFPSAIRPQLGVFSFVSLKFSTATRKLSCIPTGCNLTSALPTNLSTLSCTLLLMGLRCGGTL